MKPHKISTHLAYSDNCYFHVFLSVVWLSWNFGRFCEILFQTDAESFSFLSWNTKKVLFLKKIFFKPFSISKQKRFVYWPNFQWRFWGEARIFFLFSLSHINLYCVSLLTGWLSSEIFIGLHHYYGMLDALINNAAIARKVAQCTKRIQESGGKKSELI